MSKRNTYAVILAGGVGTRLWPLSRRSRPKQFLRIIDGRSLLQHAKDRLIGLFPPEAIYVVTNEALAPAVRAELPELSPQNVISEPDMRDTANAIGLAAQLIGRDGGEDKMLVTTADHIIEPVDRFQDAVRDAMGALDDHPQALATFGVRPTKAHTGYGYLHVGSAVSNGINRVNAFKEKPNQETAERYVADGNYLWNSGMFAWRIDTLLSEFERALPENAKILREIVDQWGKPDCAEKIAELYSRLPRTSIDYGVMEKATDVITLELPCTWWDVGSWDVVAALQPETAQGNTAIGAQIIELDAANNLMVADDDHLIAALGVDNLVIVKTNDATFICSRDHLSRMREVVEACRDKFGSRYD